MFAVRNKILKPPGYVIPPAGPLDAPQVTELEFHLNIKSFHPKLFEKALNKILNKTAALNLKTSKSISLPTKIQRYTVLRSPHIDKKSREQFEIKHYKKLLVIYFNPENSFEVANIQYIINYINNSLSGCQLNITYLNK
jgi:small subunit ribosomal protein S10